MVLIILALNVIVYGVMVVITGSFEWSARTLLGWGGNLGLLSLHGQSWRLLTSTYLHASFVHIFGNMVLLSISGTITAARIGQLRFLLAYTICGVAASLLAAEMHPDVVSIGASGAIAGVVGIMVVLYFSERAPEISGRWLAQIVGLNALYSFAPDVDGTAHLGGFAAGIGCGLVLLAIPGGLIGPAGSPEP